MDWAVSTSMTLEDHVSATFRRMEIGAGKFGNSADKAFKRASSGSSRFGDIVKGVLTANLIQRGVSELWELGKASVQLASDLTEVQNVVDTTFGQSSQQINQWSKNAISAFGLSELQAKRFTGTMGAMLKSSGLAGDQLVEISTNLTGLSGDFASFYNLPIEQAFEKIRSGISGETEPLKQLGINMSVANLQAFALTQGISKQWKAMTQAEQVQLRYNYLMKVSSDAQGDFSKTLATSFANQQRVLSTKLQQAGATIMTKFLPMLTTAFTKINQIIDKIDFGKVSENFASGVDKVISVAKTLWPIISGVASVLGTLFNWIYVLRGPLTALIFAFVAFRTIMATMSIISTVITLITTLQGGMIMAGGATAFFNSILMANPIVWIAGLIALLIGSLIALVIYWDEVTAAVNGAFTWFDSLGPVLKTVIGLMFPMIGAAYMLWKYWDKIVGAVKGFLGIQDDVKAVTPEVKTPKTISDNVKTVIPEVKTPSAMPEIMTFAMTGIGKAGSIPIPGGGGEESAQLPSMPSQAQISAPTPESQTQKMKLEFYGRIDVFGLPKESKFTRTGGNAPDIDIKMLGENK